MANELKDLHLAFIGCSVMGESMIAGLLRQTASHPREIRRNELAEKHGISVFESNGGAAKSVAGHENPAVLIYVPRA